MALALAGLEAAGTAKEDPLSHANREPLVIVCGPPNTDDRFAFRHWSVLELQHTDCSILGLFGLTPSPIARSSKKKRTTPKQTLGADESPKIDR
jgi:hypothetical protein